MHADVPAWRTPVLWLVVALPLAILAAGAHLIARAAGPGATDGAAEPVRRMAQVQTTDLDADLAAARASFAFALHADAHALRLRALSADARPDARLELHLHHPVDARADRALPLRRTTDGWIAEATVPRSHDWRLVLAPADGRWRVVGRLPRGAHAATLRPALEPR